MWAAVESHEVRGGAQGKLAFDAVGQREGDHVEAEALKVPNVLDANWLAPGLNELAAALNKDCVVLWGCDQIEVDV